MQPHEEPPACSLEVVTTSREETLSLAAELGKLLCAGDVVALVGDLGSGKTTFTKGLCLGLGLEDAARVSSPTYVLEHIYPTPIPLHHFDVYRLGSIEELVAIGFEERLKQRSVVVVEWADKVAPALPSERLEVELSWPEREWGGGKRRILLSGPTRSWSGRLDLLRRRRAQVSSPQSR